MDPETFPSDILDWMADPPDDLAENETRLEAFYALRAFVLWTSRIRSLNAHIHLDRAPVVHWSRDGDIVFALDLHGFPLREVAAIIHEFTVLMIRFRVPRCRIIHGHGSGFLRRLTRYAAGREVGTTTHRMKKGHMDMNIDKGSWEMWSTPPIRVDDLFEQGETDA